MSEQTSLAIPLTPRDDVALRNAVALWADTITAPTSLRRQELIHDKQEAARGFAHLFRRKCIIHRSYSFQLNKRAKLLVGAARQLGFTASRNHTLSSIDELAHLLNEGLFPIVYVDLWRIRGGQSGQFHSLVVIHIEHDSVMVLDPLVGESKLMRDEFQAAWSEMHCLTVVITN